MADEQPTPDEWRPVLGYEGWYEVSQTGRVRSLDCVIPTRAGYSRLRRGREKATVVSANGYYCVSLSKDGKNRSVRVHRVLYEAFVGPIPDGEVVRHLNDVRTDNRLENLAVGTHSDNRHDSVRNGSHHQANLNRCPEGHSYDETNTRFTAKGGRYCLACHRDRSRAWKKANREKVRAANREYMRGYRQRFIS